jgi:hypothetical protein
LREIAQRHGLSPIQLILRCAPREVTGDPRTRVEQMWARRCQRMMVDGVRLPFAELRAGAVEHPIRGDITGTLVLCRYDAGREVRGTFRATTKGTVDAHGHPLAIEDDAPVGIAHPVELAAIGELEPWQAAVADQPFHQLRRTMYALTPEQAMAEILRDVGGLAPEWLYEQGWEQRRDESIAERFVIHYARCGRGVEATLSPAGALDSIRMMRERGATPVFGDLDPVSQSELLYSFLGQRVVASATPTAPPPGTALSRFPYAEVSPSGRALCVQCGKPIAKGSVRVAVERRLDTGEFQGPVAGDLHPACVASYPALAGREDRDRVIAFNSAIPWPP